MFPGYNADAPTREQYDIELAALGLSVVEVERAPGGGLRPVMGRYNRRITADTPFTLTGPGAGTDFVKTAADPTGRAVTGTFANCAGGVTPWGTVLSGEENFQEYFGAAEGAPKPNPVYADRFDRYGIPLEPSVLKWETFDPRFDATKTPNEPNRFGYIVELNPWDPNSTPVKHTAMGRFRHEGANIYVTDDGTVVAYSGDDQRFDYMYKFVSSKKMQPGSPNGSDPAAMAHNLTLLDEGTLYVAKLSSDIPANEIDGSGKPPSTGSFRGTGTWIPLLRSGPGGQAESLVPGVTAEEAAVFTRFAADKAGATKMDRPEDFEANPKTGKVYVALTNNDERGAPGEAPTGRGQPAHRQQERADPRDHRQPRGHGLHLGAAAGVRRPRSRRHLFRRVRQDEGQPHLVSGQPGLRQPRQPVDLDRRQCAGLQRRVVRRRTRGRQPRRDQAVPHRAARCRNVWPGHHRRPGHRVRTAPG